MHSAMRKVCALQAGIHNRTYTCRITLTRREDVPFDSTWVAHLQVNGGGLNKGLTRSLSFFFSFVYPGLRPV